MRNIELLSPCGDFERLKLALKFGADAVYLAGEMFGMRTNPSNFSADELKKAVELAHSLGKKVYLTCNTLPRNEEIEKLPEFLKYAQKTRLCASCSAQTDLWCWEFPRYSSIVLLFQSQE